MNSHGFIVDRERNTGHPPAVRHAARHPLGEGSPQTNRESLWLFPGRHAGEPLQPSTLSTRVHALGIPSIAGRAAAIRQYVLDMPAPIVATVLGYHHVITTRLAAEAGTPVFRT